MSPYLSKIARAIEHRDEDRFRRLIAKLDNSDLNNVIETPAMLAARLQAFDLARIALESRPQDLVFFGPEGESVLSHFVLAPESALDDIDAILEFVVAGHHKKLLISHDYFGATPFMRACVINNRPVAERLLDAYRKLGIAHRIADRNRYGEHALSWAIDDGQSDFIEMLLNAYRKHTWIWWSLRPHKSRNRVRIDLVLRAAGNPDVTSLRHLIDTAGKRRVLKWLKWQPYSALVQAIRKGCFDNFHLLRQLIVDAGLDHLFWKPGESGISPLSALIGAGKSQDAVHLIDLLYQRGHTKGILSTNRNGITLLMDAVWQQDRAVLLQLLELCVDYPTYVARKAKIRIRGQWVTETALTLAAWHGWDFGIEQLLEFATSHGLGHKVMATEHAAAIAKERGYEALAETILGWKL